MIKAKSNFKKRTAMELLYTQLRLSQSGLEKTSFFLNEKVFLGI